MVRVDVPETGGETRILGSKLRRHARFRTDVLQIPLKSLGLWWACGPSSWCFACCAKAHERPPGNMTAIDPVYHRLRPTCASSPPWATIYSHLKSIDDARPPSNITTTDRLHQSPPVTSPPETDVHELTTWWPWPPQATDHARPPCNITTIDHHGPP